MAEAVAPVIVTSTRRRGAGRPAGPPAAVPEPDAETPDAQPDAATPAAGEDARDAAAVASAGGTDGDEEHGPSLVHVPVKKKGSRKR